MGKNLLRPSYDARRHRPNRAPRHDPRNERRQLSAKGSRRPSTRSRTAADTRDNQRITLIVAPRQSRPHLHEIALALSSRRDNHHFAATAKMAILFVAAFSHPDCRATVTQRAKVGAAILQPFDDFEEVAHRTGEAIEADDDEDIAGPDFAHQPGEFRPSPRRARPVLLVDCRAARRAQFVCLCVRGLILGRDPRVAQETPRGAWMGAGEGSAGHESLLLTRCGPVCTISEVAGKRPFAGVSERPVRPRPLGDLRGLTLDRLTLGRPLTPFRPRAPPVCGARAAVARTALGQAAE